MGRYLSIPLLFVATILQTTIIPQFRAWDGGPDLVLMLVLSWTLLAGLEEGLIWAIIGGVLEDLATSTPVGTTSLALVCACTAANLIAGQTGRGNLILPLLVAASATAVYHGALFVIFTVIGLSVDLEHLVVYVTLPTIAFNAALILIPYRLLGAFYHSVRPRGVST